MLLRRTKLLLATAAVLLLTAPGALAEEPPEDFEADREAGYLGVSGLFGAQTIAPINAIGLRVGNSGGVSARMGFRMARYAAVEVEAEFLDSLGKNISLPWNVTANIKAIYPFGPDDRIQPFVVGGAGVMSAEITRGLQSNAETDGVYKIGGGVDVFVTRHWGAQISTMWTNMMSSSPGLSYVAVKAGVTYVFR